MLAEEPEFDPERFERAKGIPSLVVEMFEGQSEEEAVPNTIRYLIGKCVPVEKLVEMRPYIVRFFEEKYSPEAEKESIDKVEAKNDSNASQPNGFGQDGDAGKGTGDVRGTKKSGNTREGGAGSSERGPGDVSPDERAGDNGNSAEDGRSASDGESTEGDGTNEPGTQDSNRTGDRVPERKPRRDYIAPIGSLTREGSWKQAAENNLDAIELVKEIEAQNRVATPEEQAKLAKFVGWGARELANNIFKDPDGYAIKSEWKELAQWLARSKK